MSITPGRSTRVLILTNDPIGVQLAGPGIRARAMAEELSKISEVRLLTWGRLDAVSESFELVRIAPGDRRAFTTHEAWADVIIFRDAAMELFPLLARSNKVLVADLYVPATLEHLEFDRGLPLDAAEIEVAHTTWQIEQQLRHADFFICASERQRSYWLGQLTAAGRVNPATYRDDPTLRRLIDVAPFGLSSVPPAHTKQVLKGVVPGISPDDKVLIWGGGIHNWFDPLTLIRAVGRLAERRADVRLFFMGTRNPNPAMPEGSVVRECRALAASLGISGTHVFFNEAWVDFEDRQNYLLEADLGVSTHPHTIEAEFSFRTRVLDYIWAGLPMVVTEGDHFGDLVREMRLGIAVPPSDVEALTDALETELSDDRLRAADAAHVLALAEHFAWSRTLATLIRFVQEPRRAADRSSGRAVRYGKPRRRPSILMRLPRLLRREGIRGVAARVRRRLFR